MLHKSKLFCFFLFILFFSNSTFSQNNPVDFTISLANGKKIYRKGEPIWVNLSFVLNQPNYKIRMNNPTADKVEIFPNDGIYDWKFQNDKGNFDTDHVFSYQTEYKNPTVITIALNDYVRFDKVGKYSVNVTTSRVNYADPNAKPFDNFGKRQPPMTSNTVDFEITEMSETEETEEVNRLVALIKAEKDWRKRENLDRALSFLIGDPSTKFKVNQYLNPPNYTGNYQHHVYKGLLLAPNKNLAVKLFEEAFADLNREPRIDILFILSNLKVRNEIESGLFLDCANGSQDCFRKARDERFNQIKQNYLAQLFESLPNRKGQNLISAAITLFNQLPREDISSNVYNTTKAIILNNFDDLNPYTQLDFLERFWEKIKTPSLTSSIVKILSRDQPPQYTTNATLLKRLLEIDQKLARPFVIREIKKPNSLTDIKVLAELKDEYLPEVDDFLLNQIRESVSNKNSGIYLRFKTQLAARFATKKIYDELMKIYLSLEPNRHDDDRAGFLAYFVRHNENEAFPLIAERLKKWDSHDGGHHIFYGLTQITFAKGTEKLLKKRVENNVPKIASTAIYFLSRNGAKENRELIEKHYQKWLKQWQPLKTEFDNPNADKTIQEQKWFQVNTVSALKSAKSWKLTAKEIEALKQTCFSQDCLKNFPKN